MEDTHARFDADLPSPFASDPSSPFVPSEVEARAEGVASRAAFLDFARDERELKVLLVDPSLFTAPYDAALTRGLTSAGVAPRWVARRLRGFEEAELDPAIVDPLFYPLSERGRARTAAPWRAVKGFEHALGLARLVRMARAYDVVHLQWAMLPWLDARAIRATARHRPVVVTLHDSRPFNGKAMSRLRTLGLRAVLDAAARVIVHTEGARDGLVASGTPAARIAVIPHGALPVKQVVPPPRGARWRVLLFGRMQSYKGIDVAVEALGLMSPAERARIELVIAGESRMDLAPVRARAVALGLDEATLRFDARHFSGDAMAACLAAADCFVLPYRAIEASGVLYAVAGLGKWIVASDVGAFRDMIDEAVGERVPPGDAAALARALVRAIGRVPATDAASRVTSWEAIGAATRAVYEDAIAARAG